MSDIEDGELLSSDDEDKCLKKKDKASKNRLNDNDSNLKKSDSSLWNYEESNIKKDVNDNFLDSDGENMKTDRSKKKQYSNDGDRKRAYKPGENIEIRKKRKSEHTNVDDTVPNNSKNKIDSMPPKRRILCKYYAAGDCKNNTTCTFMHEDFPCKFFHDESTACRAGLNCKYSHDSLTEEMKKVLEGFIHEGKEKSMHTTPIPTFNNQSFIRNRSPSQLRTNCLLPTPVMTNELLKSENVTFEESHKDSYKDISNYPERDYSYTSHISYGRMEFNRNNPNYPIKSEFTQKFPKPGSSDFLRIRQILPENSFNLQRKKLSESTHSKSSFHPSSIQRPFQHIGNSDNKFTYFHEHKDDYVKSYVANEENIVPYIYNKMSNEHVITNKQKQLNHKIHAPARFIVGNQDQLKLEKEHQISQNFEMDFRDAIKKLAEQIVDDTLRGSPSSEKCILMNVDRLSRKLEPENTTEMNTSISERNYKETLEIDTSNILKNIIKTEVVDSENDGSSSMFRDENDMSESDKMYIEEMKSHINLNAQYENITPWNLRKLHTTKKIPYALSILQVNNIHDNPLADPRLIGHPVLNFLVKSEELSPTSMDEDESSTLFMLQNEKLESEMSMGTKKCLSNNNIIKRNIFDSMF